MRSGVGQKNIRKVPSDTEFRMRADALAKMIEEDKRAGKRPFCVVATVGTTSSTSIDPVPQIAEIAAKHGLWLHVDCAYAGAAAVLPEQRHIMTGVERAHSLVLNAHKWLLTPIDLSAFYTRHPDILRRAFRSRRTIKTQDDPRAHNLMDYGVPLGHRFRALKLWFVIRCFLSGYALKPCCVRTSSGRMISPRWWMRIRNLSGLLLSALCGLFPL